jgi:hypothetical protein
VQQIGGPGAPRFRPAFLGRARFFSGNAAAAALDGPKPQAAAAAAGEGQSGKSEQGDAGKPVRGGVSFALPYTKCFVHWSKLMQLGLKW